MQDFAKSGKLGLDLMQDCVFFLRARSEKNTSHGHSIRWHGKGYCQTRTYMYIIYLHTNHKLMCGRILLQYPLWTDKIFAYDDLTRETNTNFERSNVDLFARLRDMGFGYARCAKHLWLSSDRAWTGGHPAAQPFCGRLGISTALVDAILNSSLSYMRLVFFDSAGKGQNLSKSSIRICQGVFCVCVRVR